MSGEVRLSFNLLLFTVKSDFVQRPQSVLFPRRLPHCFPVQLLVPRATSTHSESIGTIPAFPAAPRARPVSLKPAHHFSRYRARGTWLKSRRHSLCAYAYHVST